MCLPICRRSTPSEEPSRVIRLVPLQTDPRTLIVHEGTGTSDVVVASPRHSRESSSPASQRSVYIAQTLQTLDTPRAPAPTRRQMMNNNVPRRSSTVLPRQTRMVVPQTPPVQPSYFSETTVASDPGPVSGWSTSNSSGEQSRHSTHSETPRYMGHRPSTGLQHPRPVQLPSANTARMSRQVRGEPSPTTDIRYTYSR